MIFKQVRRPKSQRYFTCLVIYKFLALFQMHLPGCAFDKMSFKEIVLQYNLYYLDLQAVPN